jgi:curved DNA-binding protein CbpA
VSSPFTALGLEPDAGLSDDDVRAAWRRIAAATHPDRDDGGNVAAFAAAATAYALLRTAAGRGEASSDLIRANGRAAAGPLPGTGNRIARGAAGLTSRVRRGRPGRLAIRLAAATAASAAAVVTAGWQPATAAVLTGALTWLILTGRGDVAGRPR